MLPFLLKTAVQVIINKIVSFKEKPDVEVVEATADYDMMANKREEPKID